MRRGHLLSRVLLSRFPLARFPLAKFLLALPVLAAVAVLGLALALPPAPAPTPGAGAPASPAAPPEAPPSVPVPGLLVHVSGAVANPGVFRLQRGDRISAAIAAAGGVTAAADPMRLPDLAGRLRDGQQVRVPALRGSGSTGSAPRADLNTATEQELATIPGFTPETATAVAAYRARFGPFTTVRQLVTELGMSQADYVLAKGHVRV